MPLLTRSRTLAAVLVVLATNTGCSVIGLGVGTAVGAGEARYCTVKQSNDPLLSTRSEVRVRVTNSGGFEVWVEGFYEGVRDGALIVSNHDGEHAIALETVRELRVRSGTKWGEGLAAGFAIGLLLDVVVVMVVAAEHPQPR